MDAILVKSPPAPARTSAAYVSIGFTAVALLLLAALHVLSPEFAPSWRMISDYANGHYGWVLSLTFVAWALGTWSLATAVAPGCRSTLARVGLAFLVLAGLGQGMAAVFDINNEVGHSVASAFGILGFPIAAMLLSIALTRLPAWREARRVLLVAANLTWISVVLLVVTFTLFVASYSASGGPMNGQVPKSLPTASSPCSAGPTAFWSSSIAPGR